jgi:hypothetical protein
MKKLIQLEELAMAAGGLFLLSECSLGWPAWAWALLFFAPDLSFLGYGFGSRVGAWTYNLFHHKGLAIGLALAGFAMQVDGLLAAGLLLFAHASFDRMLGYGLKYETGFEDTHLGPIGKKARAVQSVGGSGSGLPA